MGLVRSPFFIGLILIMLLGMAIYLRLWAIDSTFSKEDNEMIRQFDLANREAMEEAADWRLKYDEEVERGAYRLKELMEVKEALEQKTEEAASISGRLAMLEKENLILLERVESMTKELENEKLNCSTRETQIRQFSADMYFWMRNADLRVFSFQIRIIE
ncbi:acyl-CoA-binding domain protein isoform X2 [Tasmannia lanceolata]|uniref:acyl-CoA-binding domain protein isoform X2 n=1 Tax=Tasmannia lanceolata TaxID=3420 RepID=UPI00406419FC